MPAVGFKVFAQSRDFNLFKTATIQQNRLSPVLHPRRNHGKIRFQPVFNLFGGKRDGHINIVNGQTGQNIPDTTADKANPTVQSVAKAFQLIRPDPKRMINPHCARFQNERESVARPDNAPAYKRCRPERGRKPPKQPKPRPPKQFRSATTFPAADFAPKLLKCGISNGTRQTAQTTKRKNKQNISAWNTVRRFFIRIPAAAV